VQDMGQRRHGPVSRPQSWSTPVCGVLIGSAPSYFWHCRVTFTIAFYIKRTQKQFACKRQVGEVSVV